MARSILMACNGDIDKAMKHEKMPYKKKSTVMKLAKESEFFKGIEISKPRSGRLTEEEIERIHSVFIETDGYIGKTAQCTGFGKSTVSRYARARGWHEELIEITKRLLNQEKEGTNESSPLKDYKVQDDNERVMLRLKTLRKVLFGKITGSENSDIPGEFSLKIAPKMLSEAIKALIDTDKRISEREGNEQSTALRPYQSILASCAKIIEVEDESEVKS